MQRALDQWRSCNELLQTSLIGGSAGSFGIAEIVQIISVVFFPVRSILGDDAQHVVVSALRGAAHSLLRLWKKRRGKFKFMMNVYTFYLSRLHFYRPLYVVH